MKDYRYVEEYFEDSLTLAHSLNKRNEEIEILNGFGKMYIELGDIDQAIHIFNEGLDVAKTLAIQNLKVYSLRKQLMLML
jgi:tetratricopeptide (TPR) repeat protein